VTILRAHAGFWCVLLAMCVQFGSAPADARQMPPEPVERISVLSGRSIVLTTNFDITRIAVTNPAIADATVVKPRELLIDGKAGGTVSLIVWGAQGRVHYDVVVIPEASGLQQQLQALFPTQQIRATATADAIVLSGEVTNPDIMVQAMDIAQAMMPKARVVNMLQLPGITATQQVMLEVRIAEVNRRALTEFGTSFFTGPGARDFVGRVTTQQFPAPGFEGNVGPTAPGQDEGKLTFGDFLNLFVFNVGKDIGVVIRALKSSGFFQTLAEPNLIAYNGQEASFLAGGEIPVPVVQGGANAAVSIVYKEFGVRLTFRPTIIGDVIRLQVRPEVSSLDFANGVTLEGFRIPALSTRRVETEVELRNGQSFAIAGLLDNTSQDDTAKIPGLGDIPILGQLFKSRADRVQRTELVVLITPRLVRPLNPNEVPPLPIRPEEFLPSVNKETP
jgi:pilus assembly protein CpaC